LSWEKERTARIRINPEKKKLTHDKIEIGQQKKKQSRQMKKG